MELLLMLVLSAGGQPTDLASMLSPHGYFKAHNVEISTDKMVELAGKDPVDGAAQIAQLLALRVLGEEGEFKKSANYRTQRKLLDDIAAGTKAQDKLGFAKEYAARTLALLDGAKVPVPAPLGARADGLAWFPASATLVASIESRPGTVSKVTKSPLLELFKTMPDESKREFYKMVDALGNIQIQRVSFAFAEEANRKGRIYIRITGRFNHPWMRDSLKKWGQFAKIQTDLPEKGLTVFTPQGGGSVSALVGDHDFLTVGFASLPQFIALPDAEEVFDQVLSIKAKKQVNANSGALKTSLEKLPEKAVGYLVGEFPEDFRRQVGQPFGAFPKKINAHLERVENGSDVIVQGTMDNEDQAKAFVQTASKMRMDAIDALEKAPALPLPGVNLGDLLNLLNSLQIQTQGSGVHIRVLVSDEAMKTLPLYFMLGAASR